MRYRHMPRRSSTSKLFSGLDAPVMYQGGTRDIGITPFINKGNGAYPQSPAPKYYVEFDGAGHFAWTDLNPKYQVRDNRLQPRVPR